MAVARSIFILTVGWAVAASGGTLSAEWAAYCGGGGCTWTCIRSGLHIAEEAGKSGHIMGVSYMFDEMYDDAVIAISDDDGDAVMQVVADAPLPVKAVAEAVREHNRAGAKHKLATYQRLATSYARNLA